MAKQATLSVPSGYVDDLRSAVIRAIVQDADALRINHGHALAGAFPDDRAATLRIMRCDLELLEQLEALEDDGGGTLSAPHDTDGSPIVNALQEMERVLSERLGDEMGFSPLALGDVREITDRLAWATREAVRIAPALDTRNVRDGEVA